MTTTQQPGTERFQVSAGAAELYEARFVPAIFAEWAPRLADIADVRPGHAVLDVASVRASWPGWPPTVRRATDESSAWM